MRVDVHPAWRDEAAVSVDLPPGRTDGRSAVRAVLDSGDDAIVRRDVRVESLRTGAVDQCGIADDEVVHHCLPEPSSA